MTNSSQEPTDSGRTAIPACPLTTDEFQVIKARLEATYIRRDSDDTAVRSIQDALDDRNDWLRRHPSTRRNSTRSGILIDSLDDDLPTAAEKPFEARGVAVTGHSGAGKTRLLNGALRAVALAAKAEGLRLRMLYQQVPAPCTLSSLGIEILTSLGYPISSNAKQHEVWGMVRHHLALSGIQLVHLDEIQNVLATANIIESRRILDTIKTMMNSPEHPVVLVLSGLPIFHPSAEEDDQVGRRIAFVTLETLDPGDASDLLIAIETMAAKADLVLQPDFTTAVIPRLIHTARRQVGLAMEIAVGAAGHALRPRDRDGNRLPQERTLNITHFAAEFARLTGNAPFANPFLAADWHRLDVRRKGITSPAQLVEPADDEPVRRRRRRSAP